MHKLLLLTIFMTVVQTGLMAQERSWSASVTSISSTNLYSPSEIEHDSSTTAELRLGYKLPADFSLGSYLAATKKLSGNREQNLENGYISLTRKITDLGTPYVQLLGQTRAYLPLKESTREDTSYRGGVFIAPIISANLQGIGLKYVSLTWRSAYTQNFHEFETDKNSRLNKKSSLSHLLAIEYAPIENLRIEAYFLNGHSWSYQGGRRPDAYEMGQEVAYIFNPKFEMGLGHTIGGNSFKANGVESNIDAFDSKDSSLYARLKYTF